MVGWFYGAGRGRRVQRPASGKKAASKQQQQQSRVERGLSLSYGNAKDETRSSRVPFTMRRKLKSSLSINVIMIHSIKSILGKPTTRDQSNILDSFVDEKLNKFINVGQTDR